MRTKTPSVEQGVAKLSGGNQHRVVRGFPPSPSCHPDEPTRVIDVGAKYEIYELIIQMADAGEGVSLSSVRFLPNCSASGPHLHDPRGRDHRRLTKGEG